MEKGDTFFYKFGLFAISTLMDTPALIAGKENRNANSNHIPIGASCNISSVGPSVLEAGTWLCRQLKTHYFGCFFCGFPSIFPNFKIHQWGDGVVIAGPITV